MPFGLKVYNSYKENKDDLGRISSGFMMFGGENWSGKKKTICRGPKFVP